MRLCEEHRLGGIRGVGDADCIGCVFDKLKADWLLLANSKPGDIDPRVLQLVDWLVQNIQTESRLLTPNPAQYIGGVELLDTINRIWGIPREEMERLVEEANDRHYPKKK